MANILLEGKIPEGFMVSLNWRPMVELFHFESFIWLLSGRQKELAARSGLWVEDEA